jgi:DNA-binding NarL/FixJ family response regulator
MSHQPISVALVEDDPATRARLARAIQANPGLCLLKAAASAAEIMQWLQTGAADVLLVDLGLPDVSGIEVIAHCRRVQPACEVMVVTLFADEANMLRAFEAGARGYVLKDGTEAGLAQQVQQLHAGGSPMSPIIARQLLQRWQQAPATAPATTPVAAAGVGPKDPLTPREGEVLNLIARGYTYGEAGGLMGVSGATISTHVRNIYAKLDVHNKAEAVFEARNLGLLK